MRNISLVTQNQKISLQKYVIFLRSHTRFEPPFQIWASKQRTIYFVFCDLQNEVSQIGTNLKFSTYTQQLLFRVIGEGGGETPQQCQQVLKIIVRTCVIARLTVLSRSKVMMFRVVEERGTPCVHGNTGEQILSSLNKTNIKM